jgi:hypothetical protein
MLNSPAGLSGPSNTISKRVRGRMCVGVRCEQGRTAGTTETIHLVFRAEPDSEIPSDIALRRFLKAALRVYGLRCISIKELPAGDSNRSGESATSEGGQS